MTTAPYDESVQDAVARETRRRKRVFSTFISLLLVPIAIGAYALSKAPAETQKVAADVAPIVTQRVSADISAGITSKVVAQTEPMIQKTVQQEISATVEPRLASVATLRQDVTKLQQTTQKVSDIVTSATPQLAAVSGLNERLSALQGSVNQHDSVLRNINDEQTALRQNIVKTQDMNQSLATRIDKVTQSPGDPQSIRKQLDDLSRRLSGIENGLEKLQSRVSAVERSREVVKPR
jgi:chromosome segregation ATPase